MVSVLSTTFQTCPGATTKKINSTFLQSIIKYVAFYLKLGLQARAIGLYFLHHNNHQKNEKLHILKNKVEYFEEKFLLKGKKHKLNFDK